MADAAVQERTTLAWRRTGLALLVGALTIGRLALEDLGPVVAVPTVAVAVAAAWVVLGSARERRLTHRRAADPTFSVLADGRLPGVVATLVGGLAVVELLAAFAS